MKKLLFLLSMLVLPLVVSAQEFLKIVDVEYDHVCSSPHKPGLHRWAHQWNYKMPKKVILSNGHYLSRHGNHLYDQSIHWWYDDCDRIKTNLSNFRAISMDDNFIYHGGQTYWVETITYIETLTIKSAKVREVHRETSASLNGDFSYNGFLALWDGTGGGVGKANGKISGSMRGGLKTVVNIFFDNGTYASIDAADEPIWLEAEAGMKVNFYKLRDLKLYKLIF